MKQPTSVLIIYNPNAMKGKIDEYLPKIKQRLLLRYPVVEAITSPTPDGTEELALKNATKYDIIVSCGGDGTLHQVVNGVMKSGANPIVGLLPFGTCNDVARTLKIPLKNIDKAIDCILRLNTTEYDLMFDGNEYITYSLACGYITGVSYTASSKMKSKLGWSSYVFLASKYIFKMKSLPLTITADGERIHGKFFFGLLVNGESTGGFHINKGENLANNKVKLVLIKETKGLGKLFTFLNLYLHGIKAVLKSKNAIVMDVNEVEIENHSNAPFALDGEKTEFLKKRIQVNEKIKFIKG